MDVLLVGGATLLAKPNKYDNKNKEEIYGYSNEKNKEKGNISSIDAELLAVTYSLDSFRLFILNKKEITARTDCESMVRYFNKKNEKRSSTRRWFKFKFMDRITGNSYKINFEYNKGSDNSIVHFLSRIITSSYS